MQAKLYLLVVSFCVLFFAGCGNSSSASSQTALNVSMSANANIFAANVGETATNTYTFTNNGYPVSVSGLPSAMSIASNSCQNIQSSSSCSIVLQFTPQTSSNYVQNSQIVFSSNNNSQTLNISTVPSTLSVQTGVYATNKTNFLVNIGTANASLAEVDTGSSLCVADFNVTNPADYVSTIPPQYQACYSAIAQMATNNTLVTDENLTAKYGCGVIAYNFGQRPVYGFMANVSMSLATTSNTKLTTSSNTPIFISNNINNQNSSLSTNSVVFGLAMLTQASPKNFMPYPYNIMMLVDRKNNLISFGNFNQEVISQYGMVQLNQMSQSSCFNHNFTNLQPTDPNINCWNNQGLPIVFAQTNGAGGTLSGLMDTGANLGTLNYPTPPSWLVYNSSNNTTEISSAYLPTSKGNIAIQLALPITYVNSIASSVNVGNVVFQYNKVLYNQINGTIGLLPY